MSLIKWFNKPKWQNPNEQVRITAIQNSDDQELIHALPDIVASDNSVKVQKMNTTPSRGQTWEEITSNLQVTSEVALYENSRGRRRCSGWLEC